MTQPELFVPDVAPFSMAPDVKRDYLEKQLAALLDHHERECEAYAPLVSDWRRHREPGSDYVATYPFVPVSVFKEFHLRSTAESVSSVQSSGTTSQRRSTIYVDRATKKRQTLSATRILTDFLGAEKRPYIVVDCEETVRGGALSARGAAILSLAHLASGFHFVMQETDDGLRLDFDALERALDAVGDGPFVSYGFTFILYQAHLELARKAPGWLRASETSTFLHSGGWKRLTEIAVDKGTFNATVSEVLLLVIDFYGTVEQVGILYPDCSEGLKHVPYWAEVVTRRADTLGPAAVGESGLLQLMNCLPLSAPNHSVLTEDLARVVVDDGCTCGRRGTGFVFEGRAPRAEIRGCSDVVQR